MVASPLLAATSSSYKGCGPISALSHSLVTRITIFHVISAAACACLGHLGDAAGCSSRTQFGAASARTCVECPVLLHHNMQQHLVFLCQKFIHFPPVLRLWTKRGSCRSGGRPEVTWHSVVVREKTLSSQIVKARWTECSLLVEGVPLSKAFEALP